MGRHVNHRGWIVLQSIPCDDGAMCVDFFEDPSGGYGFELLRLDPEDAGRWTAVGGFGAARYASDTASAGAACEANLWLVRHLRAKQSLDLWLASGESS